jgi:3-isopropylmalate/(R)-2-methylmalate dehydratase small subunit
MEKFSTLTAIAAPLLRSNVNTDMMTPSETGRSTAVDLGKMLFLHWRYDESGKEKPDFVLNRAPFRNAGILIAGENFGCGSSRERAVWALQRFGIRTVIAPSFSDIFRENAFQNGLLPVVLPAHEVTALAAAMATAADPRLTVDLMRSVVVTHEGRELPFTVPAERRDALLEGLEEIDLIIRMKDDIAAFEARDRTSRPWIYLERQPT